MLIYDVYFKVESVVEIGWTKGEHHELAAMCTGDKGKDTKIEEMQDRDSKRQKSWVLVKLSYRS